MSMSRRLSGFAVGLTAAVLAGGLAMPAASASTGDAAKTLAGMKVMWGMKSHAQQVAQCRVWSANRTIAIASAVQAISLVPGGAHLTKAETRGVATKYLRWACSGPGGTPR